MKKKTGSGHTPPAAAQDLQVYAKLLHDGSTAVLLLNRNDNQTMNVTAGLGRCLAAGYEQGKAVRVKDLRLVQPAASPPSYCVGTATAPSAACKDQDLTR